MHNYKIASSIDCDAAWYEAGIEGYISKKFHSALDETREDFDSIRNF